MVSRARWGNLPYLLVSKHQSYLDIIITAAVVTTLFVVKREVGHWPQLSIREFLPQGERR